MFSDYLNQIDFTFYEHDIEIILRALELYAYNLHYVGRKSCEDYEQANIILFHLYNKILAHYSNYRNIGYNPTYNCKLEIDRIKKKNIYKKNFRKVS